MSDLPWGELRLRDFVRWLIPVAVGFYAVYRAIFPSKWVGEKIMKMKPKYFNYPFWVAVIGWIGWMWLHIATLNNRIEFFSQSILPQETIEGILEGLILDAAFSFITILLFGFGLSLWLYRQPAIREKGITHGLLLLRWENISLAEWRDPGNLKIHYCFTPWTSNLYFWKKHQQKVEKENKFYLEVKPKQEVEITEYLQNFIPNRVTGR
ncbi:MAG: hypothetical protein JJT76_00725 [Clostridiaceae bacterium]|nr:hypothetical protein [Clostridiaceae bacterium]